MWSSPQLLLLLSPALILSVAATSTEPPYTPTTSSSQLTWIFDDLHARENKDPTSTESHNVSKSLADVAVESVPNSSRTSKIKGAAVESLLNEITVAEVVVQLTRYCDVRSRAATDAAFAKITARLDSMQQSVASIASQQQTLQTSVGSIASQQQTLQTSVGSIADQQQTLQTSVGVIADRQQTAQTSVGSIVSQQQTLQQSVGSIASQQQTLQTSVGSISDQQEVLLQSVSALTSLQNALQQSVGFVNQSVADLSIQQETLQQSSSRLSRQQEDVIYSFNSMNQSIGSLSSHQQTIQQTVASLANKQQTALQTTLQSIAAVAGQQETVRQSVSSLTAHQQTQRASLDALQEAASSLVSQHAALLETAHSRHAEVAEWLRGLETTVSRLPGRQLGDPCRNSTDCDFVDSSECGANGVCVCAAGFTQPADQISRCQTHRLLGQSCTVNSDCLSAVAHSECGAAGVCVCPSGRWNHNAECRPAALLGQSCQYDNDCRAADNNTACTDGECQCAAVRVGSHEYRLRGGGSSCNQGRVELRQHGPWGLVCDDHWDDTDATVVCRSLNFRQGVAHKKSQFGGTDNFYMDDVKCVGRERSLLECPYSGWGNENCSDREVAGVTCSM